MLRKTGISLLRMLTLYLICVVLIISSMPSQSAARFITPGTGSTPFNSVENLGKIKTFLESKIVQQRLADFGLTGEEISSRLNQLSPDQLHQIATHIDHLDYGGDSLGVLISILVIVILVIVVLKLMGHQVIIK